MRRKRKDTRYSVDVCSYNPIFNLVRYCCRLTRWFNTYDAGIKYMDYLCSINKPCAFGYTDNYNVFELAISTLWTKEHQKVVD